MLILVNGLMLILVNGLMLILVNGLMLILVMGLIQHSCQIRSVETLDSLVERI